MKELTSPNRVLGSIQKMFNNLNQELFDNELETPIFTLVNSKSCYGYFTLQKVWDTPDGPKYELGISNYYINRPILEVLTTLCHEATHLINKQHNVRDVSRQGQYHNKNYASEAIKHGLIVEKHPVYGYCITKPGEQLIAFAEKYGLQDIRICRKGGYGNGSNGVSGPGTRDGNSIEAGGMRKQTSFKLECPVCHRSVRSTRREGLRLLCMDCNAQLEMVSR